jgi:hypothetical protein
MNPLAYSDQRGWRSPQKPQDDGRTRGLKKYRDLGDAVHGGLDTLS